MSGHQHVRDHAVLLWLILIFFIFAFIDDFNARSQFSMYTYWHTFREVVSLFIQVLIISFYRVSAIRAVDTMCTFNLQKSKIVYILSYF